MFCPSCGRDNANELKFCASCGTNLEAVSRALTGREEDVVTRLDAGLDHFIGRYAEHIFEQPGPGSGDHTVLRSWRLLGQALVTTLIDQFMVIIMWNILPARFLLLLITSPIRLLSERSRERTDDDASSRYEPPPLEEPQHRFLEKGVPSVTEETTTNLTSKRTKEKVPITDKLK